MKNTFELENREERELAIVGGVEAIIMTICIIGYISCMVINFIPATAGDKLLVAAVLSWVFSTVLSLQIAEHFRGTSSYGMFRKFCKAMFVLLFLYLAAITSILLLTDKTEPPRLAGAFSALPMFAAAILKAGNKPK